jgi:hypothetical protein
LSIKAPNDECRKSSFGKKQPKNVQPSFFPINASGKKKTKSDHRTRKHKNSVLYIVYLSKRILDCAHHNESAQEAAQEPWPISIHKYFRILVKFFLLFTQQA